MDVRRGAGVLVEVHDGSPMKWWRETNCVKSFWKWGAGYDVEAVCDLLVEVLVEVAL